MLGRERVRHGSVAPVDVATWLGEDPYLALVTADLSEWLAAHPCDCEAVCRCDDQGEQHAA